MTLEPTKSPTAELADPRLTAKVSAILQALSKFIHGKKIYAKNNPTLDRFASEFRTAVEDFFSDQDELVISIEQHAITWNDVVVYENAKREGSLAFVLYKDGIGELTFLSSIDFEELDAFVDIIKEELHSFASAEDVVTRLWKADFENISYRVLDEYLVGEFGEGNREDEGHPTPLESEDHPDLPSLNDTGRVLVCSDGNLVSLADYLQQLAVHSVTKHRDMEQSFQDLMESFFTVSSEELRIVQEEILEENKHEKLSWFLETILDFTLLADNPSAVRDVSNVIGAITDYIVAEGDPRHMAHVLTTLRQFSDNNEMPIDVRGFIAELESKLVADSVLDGLAKKMTHARAVASVLEYLQAVGPPAVPRLCGLLETLDGAQVHKEICRTLMAIAPEEMTSIIERLDMDKPHVARDVVYMIQASGTSEIPELIRELMYYPDTQVRTEVVTFLQGMGDDEAAGLMAKLLTDEEKAVRMKALAAAEWLHHPLTTAKVVEIAESKELVERSVDEREHVLRAFAVLDPDGALAKIKVMLEKRSFFSFGKAQAKDEKLIAIRALECIGGPQAERLLAKLAEDASNLVQSKARRALESVKVGDDA